MKKVIFSLIAMALLTCTACKKENPAEAYAGNYGVATTIHMTYSIPIIGEQTYDRELDEMNCTISLNGDEGDVNIVMGDITTTGTVDESGLHAQPATTTLTVMDMPVDVTFTFPTIAAPTNGVTSWTADVNATFTMSGISINAVGTANQVATMK